MYDFIDRPVERLCNSSRFLLWAMRSWTFAAERGHCPPRALSPGFASVHALSALPDFHAIMAMFRCDGMEKMQIAPVACRYVAEDEAILLGLWRQVAARRTDSTRATLALLIDEDSIGAITAAFDTASARLQDAGFDISTLSPTKANHQE